MVHHRGAGSASFACAYQVTPVCTLQAVTKAIEAQDKLVDDAKASGSLVDSALGTQEY